MGKFVVNASDGSFFVGRKHYNRAIENNNCQGSGPHTAGEVRVMPAGGDSNMILCGLCWLRELHYRSERNRTLADFAQFDLPRWSDAKVYEG